MSKPNDNFPEMIFAWTDDPGKGPRFSSSRGMATNAPGAPYDGLVAVYMLHHIDKVTMTVKEEPVYFADWADKITGGKADG